MVPYKISCSSCTLCVYIVYVNYWIVSLKAVVQVDWPIKSLSMHIQSHLESQREITHYWPLLAPSPYLFAISICSVNMNVYAQFDETLSMTLQIM